MSKSMHGMHDVASGCSLGCLKHNYTDYTI